MTLSSPRLSFEQWKSALLTDQTLSPFRLSEKAFLPSFPGKEFINFLSLCLGAMESKNVSAQVITSIVDINDDPNYMLEFFCSHPHLNKLQFRLEVLTESKEYHSVVPIMTMHGRIIFPMGGSFAKQHFPSVIKHVLAVPYFLWVKLPHEPAECLVQSGTVVLAGQALDESAEDQWMQRIRGVNQGEKEVSAQTSFCFYFRLNILFYLFP